VFVKPGEHEAEARSDGKIARAKFNARQGSATPVTLNIRMASNDPSPDSTPPPLAPPPPATAPSTGSWAQDLPPPGNGPYLSPGFGPMAPGMQPEPSHGARKGFVRWVSERPASWVLLGLTGLGVVGTIGFSAAAASTSSAASDVTSAIVAETQNPQSPSGKLPANYYSAEGNPIPCGREDDPNSAHPYYRDACDQLRSNRSAYQVDVAFLATSIVTMALAGGGTALYYYLDSAPRASGRPGTAMRPFVTFAPILTAERQGMGLAGIF
jgi:hypothetical protein